MSIYTHKISVPVAGVAGSASGSASSKIPANGKIAAVYVKYTGQPALTTDVEVKTAGNNSPAQSILTLINKNTDGWFYPQALLHKSDGTALTTTDEFPVDDYLIVTVAQGDPGSVDVWVLVEC